MAVIQINFIKPKSKQLKSLSIKVIFQKREVDFKRFYRLAIFEPACFAAIDGVKENYFILTNLIYARIIER